MAESNIVNTVYHSGVLGGFTIGYAVLGKKIFGLKSVDVGKVDVEDAVKLTAYVTSANFTRNWLVAQGILPPNFM